MLPVPRSLVRGDGSVPLAFCLNCMAGRKVVQYCIYQTLSDFYPGTCLAGLSAERKLPGGLAAATGRQETAHDGRWRPEGNTYREISIPTGISNTKCPALVCE